MNQNNICFSEIKLANSNDDVNLEEAKLGGYRPLYPPYFIIQHAQPNQQRIYQDGEYYTRVKQFVENGQADFDTGRSRRSLGPRKFIRPVLFR